MIKTCGGEFEIDGTLAEIIADTGVLARGLGCLFRRQGLSDEVMIKFINSIYTLNKEDENASEIDRLAEEIINEIYREIAGNLH